MPRQLKLVDVEFEAVMHETSKAWLVDFGDGEGVWLPKSAVELDEDDGVATMPEWLAIEKGLV